MAKKNSTKTVPELRFRGFTNPWEQRQLGEVTVERTERSADGELLSVSMSRGVYPASLSDRKDNSSTDKSNYKRLAAGDIVYNSMRMWQGACGLSPYDGIVSPAYTVVAPTEEVDARYLVDLFKTTRMLQKFQRDSQGLTSDTWNLKYPAFSKIGCSLPTLSEQHRIGEFFSTLDNLIAAAERQEALLRRKKQAYLQLMFPRESETEPRLRFAKFSGEWERRQLGEVARRVTRRNLNNECSRVLTASAEAGLINQQEYFQKRVASHDLSHYYLLERGDFAYNHSSSGNATLGIVKRLDAYDSGCLSTLYIVFHPERDIDSDYLLHYFESSAWHGDVAGMVTEGARNHGLLNISPDTFFTARCSFPTLPEQRRIGSFFSTLDNLIAAAERRTESLRALKAAYLQRMFV